MTVRRALIAVAIAVAVLAAAALTHRGSRASGRLAREAAAHAAALAEAAPRDPWGGPLRPAPLLSRGAPVRASRPGAGVLVDGVYRGPAWSGGFPSPAAPAWAALRIGEGPTRVLVSWTSSHNHDYRDQFYGAPVDYRVETSADSTDGADGTWRTAVTVAGNPFRSRAHAIDFAGQRWVRLTMTRLADAVNQWGLFLDEIDVHDLTLGGDDVWVFLGDSIGAAAYDRAPRHRPAFADDVAAAHPGYMPALIDAGFCRARTFEVLERIDDVLAANPAARVFAITVGANDGDPVAFRTALDAIVARIRAAGRIAVVARIPFQTKYGPDFAAPKNAQLDEVVAAKGLLPGPDLYAWFKARPERLADGLHFDDEGAIAANRLWAEAVDRLYPAQPAPSTRASSR